MGAHPRLFRAFESPPIHPATAAIAALAVVFLFRASAVAQDYPPYGPDVPLAHFDHAHRAHQTPPPPKLKCPVLSPSCDDVRTAQSEWNTELLGYDSLDGRSTYQPLVVRQGGKSDDVMQVDRVPRIGHIDDRCPVHLRLAVQPVDRAARMMSHVSDVTVTWAVTTSRKPRPRNPSKAGRWSVAR